MSTISRYFSKSMADRVYLYRDGIIYSRNSSAKETSLTKFSVLLVSNQYLIEMKHFFKISKRSELRDAAKIFAQNNAPFPEFEYWLDFNKSSDGYFVNIYYMPQVKYEALVNTFEKGGVLLPEALVARAGLLNNSKIILETGSYNIDLSGNVYFQQDLNVLDSLFNKKSHISYDNQTFAEHLSTSFKLRYLFDSLDKFQFSKKSSATFSVLNALLLFGIVVGYISLSSAYLYLDNKEVIGQFEKNKQNLREVSNVRREYEELQTLNLALNEPFQNYTSKTRVLEALNVEDVQFELTSFIVNGTEVSIRGESLSATKLFKALSNNAYFSSVRYKTPVRQIGETDIFSIGLEVKQQ